MGTIKTGIKAILFPIYFLISLPVEYDVWKAYKEYGKTKDNYIKWMWNRI
jgi:hypothetical protein